MSPVATNKAVLGVNVNAPRPVLCPDRTRAELEIIGKPRVRYPEREESTWRGGFISIPLRFVAGGPDGEEYLNFFQAYPLPLRNKEDWEIFTGDSRGNEYTDKEAKVRLVRENNRRDNVITDFMNAASIDLELGLVTESRTDKEGNEILELPEWAGKRLWAIVGVTEATEQYEETNRIRQVEL